MYPGFEPSTDMMDYSYDSQEQNQLDDDSEYNPRNCTQSPSKGKKAIAAGGYPLGDHRVFNRGHRAACRLLRAQGWSAKELKDSSPIAVGSMATITRALENDYKVPDNVASDDEHADYLQTYIDNNTTPGVSTVVSGAIQKAPARKRVQPSLATPPSFVRKPEKQDTIQIRAFLRNLDEPGMEGLLPALQAGGIREDKTFLAILKWSDEDITEFFRQFERSNRLTTFQWFCVKKGLTGLRSGMQKKRGQ
ncbi:hypothetical protein BV22DRAFT_313038 [Leucogyrophana mollusca]|uniref:Uncharacterized protein n=1 Tax=Leucogyrophana mollusca TaxID=85980 RepID=A0ACB8BPY7_9AGAM|nr:hypothetical protein BV22DRAFT_313038 [Leucogyrophana mollusca]